MVPKFTLVMGREDRAHLAQRPPSEGGHRQARQESYISSEHVVRLDMGGQENQKGSAMHRLVMTRLFVTPSMPGESLSGPLKKSNIVISLMECEPFRPLASSRANVVCAGSFIETTNNAPFPFTTCLWCAMYHLDGHYVRAISIQHTYGRQRGLSPVCVVYETRDPGSRDQGDRR